MFCLTEFYSIKQKCRILFHSAKILLKYASHLGRHGLFFVFFLPLLDDAQMNHTNDLGTVLQHYSEINI